MPLHQNQILQRVNESGFPFQFRIREDIRKNSGAYGWNIVGWEEPWNNEHSGESGFIDLVLANRNHHLILECKRVTDGDWIFLIPENENYQLGRMTTLNTAITVPRANQSIGWYDPLTPPTSLESSFCVMRRDGHRDSIQLEKLASDVVHSMEATALKWLQLGLPRANS
jgi:hypothetical protein